RRPRKDFSNLSVVPPRAEFGDPPPRVHDARMVSRLRGVGGNPSRYGEARRVPRDPNSRKSGDPFRRPDDLGENSVAEAAHSGPLLGNRNRSRRVEYRWETG